MTVWEDIDKRKAKFDAEMRETAEACAKFSRGKPYVDEYGRWCCVQDKDIVRAASGGGSRLGAEGGARREGGGSRARGSEEAGGRS